MKKYTYSLCIFLLSAFNINAQKIKSIKITELEAMMAASTTPMVINFWATWCKPCIEEIPYFQKIIEAHKSDSVQLLLVSLDVEEEYPQGIKKVAEKRKFTSRIVWLNETNADYFCPKVDPKWSGAIPATLFLNNKKGYGKFYEEQLSEEMLEAEIRAILGK